MKTINIIYWVSTILLAFLMLSSAIPSIINSPDTIKFMAHLGYPSYVICRFYFRPGGRAVFLYSNQRTVEEHGFVPCFLCHIDCFVYLLAQKTKGHDPYRCGGIEVKTQST
jgi:hypothetical protein